MCDRRLCYNFTGKVPNQTFVSNINISDQPPLSCDCGNTGSGDFPLLQVDGNVGSAFYLNDRVLLRGRGGVWNVAFGGSGDSLDNADYRNYTPLRGWYRR